MLVTVSYSLCVICSLS
uniref:Uncharacterized protein n=1 Tax=Anguilla anguilla TaxID=7936 RepID=A0A0E9T1P8_ANGAN